ncbi:Ger(x)C family spore germination protein [Oceanobacillus bengalensis]|uniref:Ger(X)C family spore germination protein n=1 Tax=Oceanobacillus bengalensis TaxID=1435466 RepID=A0A494YUJ2_9BACI|nr:Ger(x)C family spore germination protein [Oceanobacillus bengalensis]RKQ13798.1 Ger(x)C family spore germination protein [Oceanobacillus bengalensis]
MRNKVLKMIGWPLFLFFLAGCWDAVELEERGFLSGIAVDLAEEQGENTTFELTQQFVVPAGLGSTTEAGGGKAFRNLSQTGESIFEINTKIARQANRMAGVEHLEVVIISSDVAEKEGIFADIMDVFIREQNMRRGTFLVVSEGKAKELLNVEPEQVKIPALYISELTESKQVTSTTEPTRIGNIHESLLSKRSFIIPDLSVFSDNSIDYEGLGVFRGETSQMVGTLTGNEAKGLNYIVGQNQEGSVPAKVEDKLATFDIANGDSTFKLTNRDKDNLTFQVTIDIGAIIVEYFGSLDPYKKENMEKFQKGLEEEIKRQAEAAIKQVKDDYQVDVFTFDDFLRTDHYELWEEIKEDWDAGENYFAKSDIEIDVNVTIIEPGNSFQVENEGETE